MILQPVPGEFFIFGAGFSVIGIWIDTQAATGKKFSPDFNIFWVHQTDQIFHDDIDAVLMKSSVITETEQVQFQRFTLDQFSIGHVTDVDRCKVGLSGDGTKTGKFGSIEFYPVVSVRMFIIECFQHAGGVGKRICCFVSEVF